MLRSTKLGQHCRFDCQVSLQSPPSDVLYQSSSAQSSLLLNGWVRGPGLFFPSAGDIASDIALAFCTAFVERCARS
jgi:hypothetical protein